MTAEIIPFPSKAKPRAIRPYEQEYWFEREKRALERSLFAKQGASDPCEGMKPADTE